MIMAEGVENTHATGNSGLLTRHISLVTVKNEFKEVKKMLKKKSIP